MIPQPLRSWLILHLAPGFGPASWQRCWRDFPSPVAFCDQSRAQLLAWGCSVSTVDAIKQPDESMIEKTSRWLESGGQSLLTYSDPAYPPMLKRIAAPPPLLYVCGNVACLQQPQVAIVGTRRPSTHARRLAAYFAQQLGEAGLVTTSGLALGVDACAHEGALLGKTATVAVLGNGLPEVYPAKNRQLAEKIREKGAIVSEFPLFSLPKAAHFPRRNRIISGLSLGVLVVEAALKSGSLITARYALEQNREVFAMPGSLLNPMSAGCHRLIQQGARLVTHVDDLLSEIEGYFEHKGRSDVSGTKILPSQVISLDKAHDKLLECMNFDVTSFEQLVNASGFSVQKVSTLLCELLRVGYVKQEAGRFVRVVS